MKYLPHPALHPDNWRKILRLGMFGVDCAAWQATLEALSYDITDKLGIFGDSTHNATLAFQRLRGIGIDGLVGDESKSVINATVSLVQPRTAEHFDARVLSKINFVQAQHYTKAARTKFDLVVLHSMEGAEASTKAETVSRWFAGLNKRFPAPRASAHYAIDCDSIVQMVHERDVAWAAPGANRTGIHLEHAGRARQTASQWRDGFSEPMLLLSAWLTASLCHSRRIPAEFVNHLGLERGDRGITTHNEVTQAFTTRSTHTDPGPNFPMDWYLQNVASNMAALR